MFVLVDSKVSSLKTEDVVKIDFFPLACNVYILTYLS